MHGAKTIEAYVIEYHTQVPIDNMDNLDDILLKAGHARFLADTQIDKIRPGHNIMFTEPGRYRLVKQHIAFHKYLKETECGREFADEEAVASWFDHVYTPMIAFIRQRDVLKSFPGRTEADLYAWLMLHRATLEKEMKMLGGVSDEELVEKFEKEQPILNPFQRLLRLFLREPDVENLSLQVERAKFSKDTKIDKIRPGHAIEFSEAACYELVKDHISVHHYLKGVENGHEVSEDEAVASWYDTVYLPIVNLIRKRGLLDYFPGRTEGDLYIWVVSRRAVLEDESAAGQPSDEEIIAELKQQGQPTPMVRLAHFLRSRLNR
jgi:hypothetical protein